MDKKIDKDEEEKIILEGGLYQVTLNNNKIKLICDKIGESKFLFEPLPDDGHLYRVYCESNDYWKTVYIGSCSNGCKERWRNGHAVSSKLQHPEYSGYSKYIAVYKLSIEFLHSKEKISMGDVKALKYRNDLITLAEHILISYYQPELNIHLYSTINIKKGSSLFKLSQIMFNRGKDHLLSGEISYRNDTISFTQDLRNRGVSFNVEKNKKRYDPIAKPETIKQLRNTNYF